MRFKQSPMAGSHWLKRAIGVAVLGFLVGCGQSTEIPKGTVTGSVTVDGQPVTSGEVAFFSSELGVGATSIIDADGRYQFDGPLRAGEYAVTVSGPSPRPGSPPPGPSPIPKKYWTEKTSELKFQVKQGSQVIDLALTSEKK